MTTDLNGLLATATPEQLRAYREALDKAIEEREREESMTPEAIARRVVRWYNGVGSWCVGDMDGGGAISPLWHADTRQQEPVALNHIANALRAYGEHLLATRGGGDEWQPASEPPDTDRDVLVVWRGKIRNGHYQTSLRRWWVYRKDGLNPVSPTEVSHWRELPPLPKGVGGA